MRHPDGGAGPPTAWSILVPKPDCLYHSLFFHPQAIYAYVTLMEGMGHPPDDPEAVRKQLVAAVS